MNKMCIVAKKKETYFINRLIKEVGESVALFDPWSDFMLPEAEIYIARTTGVYRNDMDLLILGSLPKDKVFNSVEVLKRFRSKPTQYQWMEENSFPCLPWLSLKNTDVITIEKFFRLYPEMVVKPLVGQGGWGIEVLRWGDFSSWWKKKKNKQDEDYLIQPYIKNSKEFRVFFLKGKDSIVLERMNKSGVAANFQNQGEAKLSDLSPSHMNIIDKMIEASGAMYGAIDLFVIDNELSILELNSVPGIEQLEQVSGRNIIRLILDSVPERSST